MTDCRLDVLDSASADAVAGRGAADSSVLDVFTRLSALQALNAKLVISRDERGIYEEMAEAGARVVGCDFCVICRYDADARCLLVRGNHGYGEELDGRRIFVDADPGVQSQAVNEEYLVHVADLDEHPEMLRLSPLVRSEVDVPVQSDQGPVALFHFGSASPAAFSPQDLQVCSLVVDQLAHSLANVRLLEELTLSRDAVIRGMAIMAESRDAHIGGHLDRICRYAELLAGQLAGNPKFRHEVDDDYIATLQRAAALHDVGKVSIPDSILLKPGRLTTDEFEIMKTHTWRGAEILEQLMASHSSNRMLEMGARVARSHHEHWDGNGYPQGLAGRSIPLAARIVAICDVYDALTSQRPYKDAWPHDRSLAYVVDRAGKQFDPYLAQIFRQLETEILQVPGRHAG